MGKNGDRNTRLFHTQSIARRKRNKIHGLFLRDSVWCTNNERLQEEAIHFYQDLFSADVNTTPYSLQLANIPQLSEEGCSALNTPVTKAKVKVAVFSMKSYKAPGPDGFQALFFKHFWSLVGDDLWQLGSKAFTNGIFEKDMAEVLLVLIPKEERPTSLCNFRPIGLCNVVF